ncbi:MAG TPA: acyl-CoA thioesterase [Bacteroidales bacterium]|jgi:acyl-CoA thioester hydrolase|nr:acyl-CoA thioesterase [Bacteroidales bacterium]HBZ22626.1 acyl-CoA thioesterase [Bacteroidales bacterium]
MQEPFYLHNTEFNVRDYECDIQGVVNNANYQHYLEHARHEFLISQGISFAQLHDEGTDLIVTKVEIEYKYPLRSRDRFIVRTNIQREGNIRLVFLQDIYRAEDMKLIVRAKITGAATKNGKPVYPGEVLKKLGLE